MCSGWPPESTTVVIIDATCDAAHVAHNVAMHSDGIEHKGQEEMSLGGESLRYKSNFWMTLTVMTPTTLTN
jgi:hypothetical protein